MKSLSENSIKFKNPSIFTYEIMKWIVDEGFEFSKNNAYCYPKEDSQEWEEKCFFKHGGYYSNDWPIHIYIFSFGIGVDVDYECGGNSSTAFWNFKAYSFEEAYDKMVEHVNGYKES
jgi:hypothetical protein